jgi:hypothetical protein
VSATVLAKGFVEKSSFPGPPMHMYLSRDWMRDGLKNTLPQYLGWPKRMGGAFLYVTQGKRKQQTIA